MQDKEQEEHGEIEILPPLLGKYLHALEKTDVLRNASGVLVLGSYGRGEPTLTSDLDTWLLCPAETVGSLQKICRLSDREMLAKQRVATGEGLPGLCRHRSSLFTQEEASLYALGFWTRVGLQCLRKETLCVWGQSVDCPIPARDQVTVDLAVTLKEFLAHYLSGTESGSESQTRKWGRRMTQELYYYRFGRVDTLQVMEAGLLRGGEGSINQQAEALIGQTRDVYGDDRLKARSLLHKVLWTLEKVRWELIEAYGDRQHFGDWRLGIKRHFGFTPREMGGLLVDLARAGFAVDKVAKSFGKDLMLLTRELPGVDLSNFYHDLSCYLVAAARNILNYENGEVARGFERSIVVPTVFGDTPSVTRVGFSEAGRFIKTEAVYYQRFKPDALLRYDQQDGFGICEVADYGGRRLKDWEISGALPDYARLLVDLHQHKLDCWGRLGTETTVTNYKEYVLSKLEGLASSDAGIVSAVRAVIKELDKKLISINTPVLCHMDPVTENLVTLDNGELVLVDFEQASGCVPEWDIARVKLFLREPIQSDFIHTYLNAGGVIDSEVLMVTELVMLLAFSDKLSSNENKLRVYCLDQVRKLLRQAKKLGKFKNVVARNINEREIGSSPRTVVVRSSASQ